MQREPLPQYATDDQIVVGVEAVYNFNKFGGE